MPFLDGTGPMGEGPLTGGGFGVCAGPDVPAGPMARRWARRAFWRGFGPGRGGWGYRHWYHATGLPYWARAAGYGRVGLPFSEPTKEEQKEMLEEEATWLRRRLEALEQQLGSLHGAQNDAGQDG